MSELWVVEFRVGRVWRPGHETYTSEDGAVAAMRRMARGAVARVARYERVSVVVRHRYHTREFREGAWLWFRVTSL